MNSSGAPARTRGSLLDLGPRARVVFAALYVAVMSAVIASAQFRPDHVFGFQMFNQSSKIDIALARRVRGVRRLLPVEDGAWQARDRAGAWHAFRWQDRVRDPVLSVLGTPVHARYGLEGQLYRLQFALSDVLAHIPDDAETTGLVASVTTRKNGRRARVVELSAERR
ncbi:MAG TPA: hypothetical protein VGQ57_16295 [Polyangiaceae bacterium]|jgi:hypothetical protein|nr:hypothetical protein [Polyangiaceae bacterium]